MDDRKLPLSDLKDLAEEEIEERREEVGREPQARELLDVPSEDPARLASEQEEERHQTSG